MFKEPQTPTDKVLTGMLIICVFILTLTDKDIEAFILGVSIGLRVIFK
ncbi:hypothetical protein GM661_04230 [Iocasia frigidifontis]|uniref:Uncharacterized protein n=1 Tax=Iocasia fonsfrigidae TaxID=2682810 RepID=A0A8A7K759_9FIRM|nr:MULTISPECIES: hypothetical protein [Halanaerobiaceae]QTL97241.1 hypothetical protein GM661_04230 [Iocasia fonsfrigidae]